MSTSDSPLSTGDFGPLRAFVPVAEALNFTRAAEKLGVSSSALSELICGLEERVGVRLLHAYPDIVLNITLDDEVVAMVDGGDDAAIYPNEHYV